MKTATKPVVSSTIAPRQRLNSSGYKRRDHIAYQSATIEIHVERKNPRIRGERFIVLYSAYWRPGVKGGDELTYIPGSATGDFHLCKAQATFRDRKRVEDEQKEEEARSKRMRAKQKPGSNADDRWTEQDEAMLKLDHALTQLTA